MKVEELILSELAYNIGNILVEKTVQAAKNDTTTFLEKEQKQCVDSFWEEFCICVQDRTFDSKIKEEIKKHLLKSLAASFNSLALYEKAALWLKSKEGVYWLYENREKALSLDSIPFSFEECKDELNNALYEKAKLFDSDNIYRFINLECRSFEHNRDEDERDVVYE